MPVEKRNVFLSNTLISLPYTAKSQQNKPRIPPRNVKAHADLINQKLTNAYSQLASQKQAAAIQYKDGAYLEFSSASQYDLTVKSLESISSGIRLLHVKTDEDTKIISATIYVPDGKESYFTNKIDKYSTETTKTGNPRFNDLISSIDDVKPAFLDAFWIGHLTDIPTESQGWCEVWLRVEDEQFDQVEASFTTNCVELGIQCDANSIKFPERIVKSIYANAFQLGELINCSRYIAQIRRALGNPSFFNELENKEQREWVDDLVSRVDFDFSNAVICILDTGVSSQHPLLASAFADNTVQSVNNAWGSHDHDSHGTEMAGIALYYNLQDILISPNRERVVHQLESVKILPPTNDNPPHLYGAITERAIYLAEISQPEKERAICMAVTSEEFNSNDGSPTSWSGSVDNIVSGARDNGEKRLFFVSGGNVRPEEVSESKYPNSSHLHSVESPGQAWNAITVGAYSHATQISDDLLKNYQPVADDGQLSPFSATSLMWGKKWPIKPEILCDGGNLATNGTDYIECSDLSLLTTHYRPLRRFFSTIWGTSSSTAQAAWLAAQIIAEYPGIWPETVRALLVHSARWTPQMRSQFCIPDKKETGRRNLLRTCGYGIPNLNRAIQCMNNSVNLVIESELQPFVKGGMNEMHTHDIPWPKDILRSLGEVFAVMRVTLSYYIEPAPEENGWKDKYRYQSCGLRFDVINVNETKTDFVKRVNVKMRGDDKKDSGEGTSGSEHWYLGSDNRDVGSIHSDFRQQTAVDLCEANCIAVYPVVGWWRERANLKRYNNKIRYSLIISISTPKVEVDLYTPIIAQVETSIRNVVEIEITL